jgi:cobalt-zinc-cadmium efflux system outer membrane protein
LLAVLSPPAHATDPSEKTTSLPPLRDFLRLVRERGPILEVARLKETAAQAAEKQAGRLPNPVFEFRTENWRFDSTFSRWEDLDVVLTATQPVELGGKVAARKGVAAAGLETVTAERRLAEVASTLEGARLYFELIRVSDLVKTLEEQRGALKDVVAAMRLRVAEGYSAEADLRKFEAEMALAEERLIRARSQRRTVCARLALIAGQTPSAAWPSPPEPPALPIPAGEEVGMRERVLGSAPEVLMARGRLRQAGYQLASERARRVPDLGISAGYKRTGGYDTAVAGVSAALPVFNSNSNAVAQMKFEEEAARVETRSAEDLAWAQFQNLWISARELGERALTVESELIAPAEAVRDSTRVSFREGASDMLRLLDAERVYAEARSAALILKHDAFLAALEVRLLLGEEALP